MGRGASHGLLVQPIIGHLSDRTWLGRLGRRRVYFVAGALLATLSLFLMPLSAQLMIAALLLWTLDASLNISMEPCRAFVGDMLSKNQHTAAYALQTAFIGAGAVAGSIFSATAGRVAVAERCGCVGIGVAWASILAMPYAILASSLPQRKLGVYMWLFNIFIFVPQLLVATVMGSVMKAFFPDQPIWTMLAAAAVMTVAALAMLGVEAPRRAGRNV